MNRLGTETAFDMLVRVVALRAQGKDIISFGIGEPDFDTPRNIKEAAKRAMDEGKTKYVPSAGIAELRKQIATTVSQIRHIPVDPDEVVVTPGAKPILFNSMMACLNEGDEVIYPNPGFPIYESVAAWIGAKPVPVPLVESKDFGLDVDALRGSITARTRMILLNSPNNPTGSVLSLDDLKTVAALAQQHNLWVLSDEIYSRLVFDGAFHSIATLPGMKERTIILDGFSKTYAMTGWRIGYGVMPKSLAFHVARIETNLNSCTAAFSQWAGIEALAGPQDEPARMAAEFKRRRDFIVAELNRIPGFRCCKPGGAFYVFPNVTGACRKLGLPDSKAFADFLLDRACVAVLPRTCFGKKNPGEAEEYVRFSYATAMEKIAEGLERIRKVVIGNS
jgi:aspartate/methionine/tyrosine aminotransferase